LLSSKLISDPELTGLEEDMDVEKPREEVEREEFELGLGRDFRRNEDSED
jgi:hypothetical protein